MQKCEQINDLGLTENSAFTPSANALTATNKARGMLFFIRRSFSCLTREIFVPVYSALVRPHHECAIQANCPCHKKGIYHMERIQMTATRWVKGLRGLTNEERLKTVKLQSLKKISLRNYLVLYSKIH